jgi:hypothetical protein
MTSRRSKVTRRFDVVFGDGATVLAAALLTAGLVNFAVQGMAVAWLASPAQRLLARLLILLFACSVPADALAVIVVRAAARRRAASPDADIDWRRDACRAGGVAGAIGLALALTVGLGPHDVGLRATYSAIFMFVYMLALGVGAVPRGVLLGTGRYRPVGAAAVTGTVVRLATFAVAFGLGAGLGGALLATMLGRLATTAVLVAAARVRRAPRVLLDIQWTSLARPILALGGLWALVAVEVVLAHRYVPAVATDPHAAETAIARILLFVLVVPQALVILTLARFTHGGRVAADALRAALRIGMGASAVAVGALIAVEELGFARVFPGAPPLPVALVFTVGVASCALGLLTILVAYHLVRGLPCAGTIWAAVAVMLAVAWFWHATPTVLATVFVLTVLAALTRLLAGPALVGAAAERADGDRRAVLPDDGGLDLTVVVPFFNPGGSALRDHVLELLDTLEHEGIRFEVLAVSDGSTDGSEQLVRDLTPRGLRTLVLDHAGKGAALRVGLENGRGRYLGFIDADGDIPAEQWHHFLTLIRMYNSDMVVGSKRHPLSELHYPALRRVYSRVFQFLVHVLFRVDVTDTQTGIKVFRREMLADVLPLVVETGFVFDLELLAVARRRGWRRVIEAPVRIDHRFRSTISSRSVFIMLRDTLVLAARMHVMRSYDTPVEPAVVAEPRPSLVASSSWPSTR